MTTNSIHAPKDVARLTLAAINEFIKSRDNTLRTYTPLDQHITMRARTLTSVIALSSNWKTGFIKYMAGEMAKRMAYDGNECVIIVTWEDSIEEYGLSNIANHTGIDVQDILRGRFDDTSMRQAVVELGARPVYVVGHSEETRRNRPNLSMSNVAQALIEFERTQKLKIKAVFLDYLQRMERDTDIRETRHQYMANAEASKDLALALNTHVVLGVQAGEDVAKRQMKIPQMGDAHEAPSAVRHVSNNMIGLWRPWATGDREGSVSVGGCAYACTPDLLFAQSVKQKMGDIGNTVALSVDFAQNKVVGEYTKG